MIEGTEHIKMLQAEWGDGGNFSEWYEGESIRRLLLEALWREALESVQTCLVAANSIGEYQFTRRAMSNAIAQNAMKVRVKWYDKM